LSLRVLILAGGLGTRISEETSDKPKPMVLIDQKPILWHIMNLCAAQGYTRFLIATGYKHDVIEKYVSGLDTTWEIECLFTGLDSQTGGRIKACLELDASETRVIATYGDGLANINLGDLISFHERHGKLATVTAVRPPARFGVLEFENGAVTHFGEKRQSDSGWINGGFFVLETEVSKIPIDDNTSFESEVLPLLVEQDQLMAYQHHGFWQPMDTLRERNILNDLARSSSPPWLSFN